MYDQDKATGSRWMQTAFNLGDWSSMSSRRRRTAEMMMMMMVVMTLMGLLEPIIHITTVHTTLKNYGSEVDIYREYTTSLKFYINQY